MFSLKKRAAADDTTALTNYNAGFYNSLTTAFNLSPNEFQLTQGAFALPDTNTAIYNVFDGVPPVSVCNLFTANDLNTLSANYQNLLGYADVQEQLSFTYKIANTNYMNVANWAGGNPGTNPMYSPSTSDIIAALKSGSVISFKYDSATADTSLQNTWAQSASSGGVWFWGYNNDSTSQSINTLATSSEVTVTMTATFASVPIQPGGWFSNAYLIQMYQDSSLWEGGQSKWNTLFGSGGSLQDVSVQAIIATDFTINITSVAAYSASQYNYVYTSSNVNVWPFYTSSSSSSTTTNYTQNGDSSITATVQSLPGAVQILGFNVSSTASLIQA